MSPNNDINMIIDLTFDIFEKNCNNYDEVRDCFLVLSVHHSKSLFLFSSECNKDYTMRVQRESNKMVKNDHIVSSNSLQLEYVTLKSQDN